MEKNKILFYDATRNRLRLGLRQSSAAFECICPSQGARGLAYHARVLQNLAR
jgi:hypothetical protein